MGGIAEAAIGGIESFFSAAPDVATDVAPALSDVATAAPSVAGDIAGTTAEGLPFVTAGPGAIEAIQPAATALTVPAGGIAGDVASIAPDVAGAAGGVGGAAAGATPSIADILGISPAAAAGAPTVGGATPGEIVSGEFGAGGFTNQPSIQLPGGGGDILSPGPLGGPAGGGAPGGGASAFAAPAGVAGAPDPTATGSILGGGERILDPGATPGGAGSAAPDTPPAAAPASSTPTPSPTGGSQAAGLSDLAKSTPPPIDGGGGAGGAGGAGGGGGGITQALKDYGPIAGAAVGAGGLAYSILNRPNIPSTAATTGQQSTVANAALGTGTTLTNEGVPLTQYVGTNKLPDAEQAALDSAASAAKQNIIAGYAARGLPTDPTKNSVLAQDLANLDQQTLVTKQKMQSDLAKTGTSLISSGLSQTQLANDIFNSLIKVDQTQTTNVGTAIANFAAALAPKGGTTLRIG